MPLTKFAKQEILKHGLKQTAYVPANSTVWLCFFTSVTGLEDGTLTNESSDAGRTIIPFGASSATTERTVLNSTTFQVTPTTGGETLTHFGIIDAATTGSLLGYGTLDNSITTVAAEPFNIAIASIGIQWDQPGLVCFSKYFIDEMLDFMFADPGTAFAAPPASYLSLHTASSATGANEFVDAAYARKVAPWSAVTLNGGNAHIETNADVDWLAQQDTPAAQWGVFDALTSGNFIAFHDAVDATVSANADIKLTATEVTIEV